MMKPRTAALAALATFVSVCAAHEFWILPSTFRANVGETVDVRLLVGDGFPGEARPRDPTRLEKFVVVGPSGESPITGEDGADPAGTVTFKDAGTHVLGYRSTSTRIALEAAKFEAYLKEEGLDHVIKARAADGTSTKEGTELFSRAAKSLVQVGGTPDAGFSRTLGFPAEVTPTTNPYTTHQGDSLTFRVTHDNGPAADALVLAFSKSDPSHKLTARTGSTGEVTFTLDRPGVWLIASVRMSRAQPGQNADWQSVWASLTFDLAAPDPAVKQTSLPAGSTGH